MALLVCNNPLRPIPCRQDAGGGGGKELFPIMISAKRRYSLSAHLISHNLGFLSKQGPSNF